MTYSEAIQYLYGLRLHGMKLGLDNPRTLARMLGHPEKALRFIHVAGTNGKGSVCAFLESMYRAAGWRTGLFTSPHLVTFGERMQVNRGLIEEEAVARLADRLRNCCDAFPEGESPTFFEVVTLMAMEHFRERGCEIVIWETGMGGRLDATNIVSPLASVITNVDWDHQRWLGDTLEAIAREKAGIIKPGVPVVTAAQDPAALPVIDAAARDSGSALVRVSKEDLNQPPLDDARLPLLGEHQRWNAAVAVAVVRLLRGVIPVTDEQLRSGLEQTCWPGRLQRVERRPGREVVLDGAHNQAGFEALCGALKAQYPGRTPALILGMLEDKDWARMCPMAVSLAHRVWLVPVSSARSAIPETLASACQRANPAAQVRVASGVGQALAESAEEPLVVIAGSLYLVGEAMEVLGLATAPPGDERGLNEWSQRG